MSAVVTPSIERIVELALEEDLGRGDVTTCLTVPRGAEGSGKVIARESMVLSGLEVFEAVYRRVDPAVEIRPLASDGDRLEDGAEILGATGSLASLLMGERVALNFMQRLSGVATMTAGFVGALPEGAAARIADTRKTAPGMRALQRMAVVHGGGFNHRADLAGGVLIKENHVASAGSVAAAVRACRAGAPHSLKVEVEVRSEQELEEAIHAGADAVLLDNMDPKRVARCVEIAAGRVITEASGGVSLETVAGMARAGVDVISVGALTHSAPSADISFLLDSVAR